MYKQHSFTNFEIRIREQDPKGYPIELTLDNSRQFRGSYLSSDILPWIAGDSPDEDGERLFNLLFADEQAQTAWVQISGQNRQRRIRLSIDRTAPELHAIPWELLRDPGSATTAAKTLATNADTPFSRHLAGNWPAGTPITERPVKILVAVANPDNLPTYGLTPIEVKTELAIIEQAFSDFSKHEVELTVLEAPVTLPKLEAEFRQGYHILHIVAHGNYSSKRETAVLYLADDTNQVELEKDVKVAEVLDQQSQKPHLIFLASCQSASRDTSDAFRGFAPQLIKAGVPTVLAMQDFVPVETAREFTRVFYHELFTDLYVDLAGNKARSALFAAGLSGGSIPVLFSRLLDNRLLATPAEVKRPLVPDKESDRQEDKELTFGETVIRNVVTTANLIEEDEQFVVGELEWLFCALDNFLQVYEIVRKRVDQAKTRVIRNFALNIQRDKEMDRIKSQIWQEEIERSQSLFVPIPPEAQRSPQANNRLLSTNDEYYLNLWAFQTEGSVKTTNLRLRNLDVLLKREAKGGEAGKSNIALQNQIRDIRIEIARDLQDFSDLMNKSYGIFLTSPKKLLDLLM